MFCTDATAKYRRGPLDLCGVDRGQANGPGEQRNSHALDAQILVVPGTAAFARVIAGVAAQLREVHRERDDLAAELEARLGTHPLGPVLTSMPGLGIRTAIKILTIVGDGSAFPTAGHLAAYAGCPLLAPKLSDPSGARYRRCARSARVRAPAGHGCPAGDTTPRRRGPSHRSGP